MRQLTLIRHALTEWNATGRFQGHSDVALSAAGVAQARRLARHLSRVRAGVDLVYSSPLSRALQTAELVFPDHEVIPDARLKELHFGVFEGFTQEQNEAHESWRWWAEDPFARAAPQGESYQALRLRAVAWLESLPELPHIAAVTHSGTIQMLLSHVLGVERPTWRKRVFLRHTSVTRLLFRGGEALIERVNDARHLADESGNPFAD